MQIKPHYLWGFIVYTLLITSKKLEGCLTKSNINPLQRTFMNMNTMMGVKNGFSFHMLCGEYGLRKALKISYAHRFVPLLGTHLGLHI